MCDDLKVDDYARYCAVLTAYSESNFRGDAVQFGKTFGVYQQNPVYWSTAHSGAADQCRAFLADFKTAAKYHSPVDKRDPVRDCWVTQRWIVPNEGKTWPDPGPGFTTARETVNYSDRVPLISQIINERRLP